MSDAELDNLAKRGILKAEPYAEAEYKGLITSARRRLVDARNESLSAESRFDLAYNASHAYALAALRYKGYRCENRYLVFQALEHTVGMAPSQWRVLSKCHQNRNLAEYEGRTEIDLRLLSDLISVTTELEAAIAAQPARP
jgi:hypothetical protein